MPGSKIGGLKTAKRNKERYGDDYYHRIGSKGGRARGPKGFALNPDLARKAGAKGGRRSRRRLNGTTKEKILKNADLIEDMYIDGKSLPQIAKELGVSYPTLYRWAKEELSVYGVNDEIE